MHSWQKGAIFGVIVGILKIILEYNTNKEFFAFNALNRTFYIIGSFVVFYGLVFYTADKLLELRKKQTKIWFKQSVLGLAVIPLIAFAFFNTLNFVGSVPIGIPFSSYYFKKDLAFSMAFGILLTPPLVILGYIKSRSLKTITVAVMVLFALTAGSGFLMWAVLMMVDLSGGGAVWGIGSGTLYVAEGEINTYSITDTSYPYAVQAEFKINYISSSPKHFLEISFNGDKEIIEVERRFNKSIHLCYRNNTYYEKYYVNENRTWWRPATSECELRWNNTYVDPSQIDWVNIIITPAYQDKDGDGKICDDPFEINGKPTCSKYYLVSSTPDENQIDNDGDGLINEDFKGWYNGKGDWETNTLHFHFQSRHLCSKCAID